MSTFDDPFDADRALSRSGCVCGQHRSAGEHDQAALALRCEPVPVETEQQRYEGVVASAVMRAMFPRDAARRAFLAASFALPAVNVGIRQQGREHGSNVLDAEPDAPSILNCIQTARSEEFRRSLRGMANPYGDGCASQRIVDVLTSLPFSEELLMKRARPLG